MLSCALALLLCSCAPLVRVVALAVLALAVLVFALAVLALALAVLVLVLLLSSCAPVAIPTRLPLRFALVLVLAPVLFPFLVLVVCLAPARGLCPSSFCFSSWSSLSVSCCCSGLVRSPCLVGLVLVLASSAVLVPDFAGLGLAAVGLAALGLAPPLPLPLAL